MIFYDTIAFFCFITVTMTLLIASVGYFTFSITLLVRTSICVHLAMIFFILVKSTVVTVVI